MTRTCPDTRHRGDRLLVDGTRAYLHDCERYLSRLGAAEYNQHLRSGKKGRYTPTEYHRTLIALANADDEIGFKTIKALRGCDSALGV